MSKKLYFICFILGSSAFHAISYSTGFGLRLDVLLNGVYWSGATLLAYHFLGRPA